MATLANKDLIEFYFSFFGDYLRNELHTVRYNKKIWTAFLKWSTLSQEQAVACVSYGSFPTINIYETIFSFHQHGHFTKQTPNDIWIRRDLPQNLRASDNADARFKNKKFLESLILHEMCHWGRHHNGVEDEYVDTASLTDTGDMFQKQAYGNPDRPDLG